MNKLMLSIGLIGSALLFAQSNAFAQHKYQDRVKHGHYKYEDKKDHRQNKFEDKLEQRQHRQSQRIERGFNQGELSYRELTRLLSKQIKFERLSREFKEDGKYSRKERKILNRKYDKLDSMIYRMKHNEERYRFYKRHKVNYSL